MIESKVPGLKCGHAIITPNCRQVHGSPLAAYEVACQRLKDMFLDTAAFEANEGADFHLVLTVERK